MEEFDLAAPAKMIRHLHIYVGVSVELAIETLTAVDSLTSQ